ncbi:Mo-dependent nitrogenase C-terminal domain-containing protein [Leptolyngbya sp. CCNP1308]|uniref:Mo-dependent nitrogenase C-terminal domain-containing protein n=1 Tax=Leptolyngbya sp. CCNP1308 TaxID=3110255 RepID=UPI002B21E8A7|nr:Mo-dependent nitrogenase C-terminal domain-containing protein [Leptolyngbya sp. CCNP1308]MEA5450652.1 Mo-dependent nitrogenase C-terminal domain-containing protein [Leptolyngbya sp. CCNP1308]
MPAVTESPYTQEQIKVWLRGLLTLAWADGNFDDDEKALITAITEDELAPELDFEHFEPVTPAEVARVLGSDPKVAENFLRMAVMVALADGVYSVEEDLQLQALCQALNLQDTVLNSVRSTLYSLKPENAGLAAGLRPPAGSKRDPLKPAREWLDQLDVHDPRLARFVCKLIPSQCPFERDVVLFNKKLMHIPPMCKINPLYEQLVGLRFRALSYLADDCGEDVTPLL